ncbi:MAG: TlpA disulfide reductase family protein [Lutibacter sp.]|uniref:TlpA disulfide reductase family protein n=1 Tax=Lutibacter sp. TaxID=1925666 RepID=UPI00299D15F8|nr:TlpA disulfide reductase family protein [Lutibacter sp.]MDX1830532.1 TlpA disulfide reductase family protein [Lutibacter sp.]
MNQNSEYYRISGKIKNYSGKIYLQRAVKKEYYLGDFIKDSAQVVNGKFEFKFSKKHTFPLPFYIETEKTRTNRFILEPQNQQIIIDSLYFNVNPIIIRKNSKINEEEKILEQKRTPLLLKFKSDWDLMKNVADSKVDFEKYAIEARNKLSNEFNLILSKFSKNHPNSYVAFWEIAHSQMYEGYNKELENAYNNLSSNIKQTDEAKILENFMFRAKALNVGSHFPIMELKNKELKGFELNINEISHTQYTLIDFWFSHCGPCIAQFPKLKELYTKYPNKLKLISISTDKTKNINNWLKVLKKNNILWPNFLDETGTSSSPLGVNSFPTNFLLNKQGIIIKKNVPLVELELLLEKH